MDVTELFSFKAASSTPSRSASSSSAGSEVSRKRSRFDPDGPIPILQKKMNILSSIPTESIDTSRRGKDNDDEDEEEDEQGLDISEEERLRILKMVEDEPEVI